MKYDTDRALRLDNQLCFPLYAAARRVIGAYTPFLKPLGITYTQYIAFMVLWERDGLSVSEICARLRLDSGTVTPLLKKMEQEGFVARKRDSADERIVQVYLTDKGRALKQEAAQIPLKVGSCVGISPQEGAKLCELLHKILGE